MSIPYGFKSKSCYADREGSVYVIFAEGDTGATIEVREFNQEVLEGTCIRLYEGGEEWFQRVNDNDVKMLKREIARGHIKEHIHSIINWKQSELPF